MADAQLTLQGGRFHDPAGQEVAAESWVSGGEGAADEEAGASDAIRAYIGYERAAPRHLFRSAASVF